MTQIPAGWYPDPDPNQLTPGSQRYWDGQRWTENIHVPGAAAGAGQAPTYAAPAGPAQSATGRATTPDGQELAGWWHRGGAYILDSLIVGAIVVVLALPQIRQIIAAYGDLIDQAVQSAESGQAIPDPGTLVADLAGPFLVLSLVGLGVSLVYHAVFLKWKAATPGKLALGLRVRLRDAPGPLSWGTVLKRWVGQFGYGILGYVPVLGMFSAFYPLVDLLWPLWDGKKQAVHDKIARTNVVRQRRG